MKRTLTTLLAMAMVIALALPVFAVTDLTTAAVTKIDTPTSGNKLDDAQLQAILKSVTPTTG